MQDPQTFSRSSARPAMRPQSGRRGNALVEFALVFPMVLIITFGVFTTGVVLERYITVLQLARNGGSMLARGADFNVEQNKQLLLQGAVDMDITTTGGEGVIYLSRVVKAPPGSPNNGKLVVAEQYIIGNSALTPSRVGTPSAAIWPDREKPLPNGDVADYEKELSARADLPMDLQSISLSEEVFIAEVYYSPSPLLFVGAGLFEPKWLSARAIF